MSRRRACLAVPLLLCLLDLCLLDGIATAQTPAPAPSPDPPVWQASGFWLARLEDWKYFDPPPGGANPDYAFLGNRARFQLRGRFPRAEVTLAAQYVGFLNLPENATGPGALGTGSLYFDQGGRHRNMQELWLRYANVRLPDIVPGLELQVGRMAYTSGAEAPSGVAKIETVKRQRLDSRLVGEFEWAIVQRGFDGVRADYTRPAWKLTGLASMPTQGGYARVAGPTITDIVVAGATLSSRSPSAATPRRTQVQGFAWLYTDDRPVTQRPDNVGTPVTHADIAIGSLGGALIGAYSAGPGEADVLLWGVAQSGDWYGQSHGAYAAVVEGGYQWTHAPGHPWLRGGVYRASGDGDPGDERHETFFPMLPTLRRFSYTTVYSVMNLNDAFTSVQVRPLQALGVRFDVHRLDLAAAADLWYAGSGATLRRGDVFGYSGRRSNGSTRLGTSLETSVDVTVTPHVTVSGFLGSIRGGRVVTGTFAGDHLWYAYLESIFSFSSR